MDRKEKAAKKFDFIRNQFTESAFTELALFDRNAKNLLNVVRLEMALHDKLERKEFATGLEDEFLLEAKEFLYIDALAKVMMLIEGFLALSDAISDSAKGYPRIAEAMASYRDSSILKFITRFRETQIDMWKLTGLPRLEKLPINEQERAALSDVFQENVEVFKEFLTTIIDFYKCNSIAYNKFKHGLSLIPGMQLKNPRQEVVAQVLTALDRQLQPPDFASIQTKERLVPPQVGWFNTLCFVPSPQKEKYELILNSLLSAISFMTSNHMFLAVNCGEDYFPLKMNPDGSYVPMLLLPKDSQYLRENKKKQLEPIIKRVTDNMNISKMTFKFNLNFADDKMALILKSFQEHGSALVWSSETATGSAKVEMTY
jgi:hypothetical protein